MTCSDSYINRELKKVIQNEDTLTKVLTPSDSDDNLERKSESE